MDVSAVKSYEKRNPLQTVINSTLIGAAVGYGAKYAIPIQEREKKNIAYRAIANSARKNENEKKVNALKILKSRTPAQDAFIKLVDERDKFKYPTLKNLAERLGGGETSLGKQVLEIINRPENKGMKLDRLAEILGQESADVKLFKEKAGDKEAFKTLTLDEITAKLGGENEPLAKKVITIFKQNDNKSLDFDSVAFTLGKNSPEVAELNRVARFKNCFVSDNIKSIVKKLGGEASDAGKEFRQIIKEVDQNASKTSRAILRGVHKHLKDIRYTAPLLLTGAAAGFAGAFIKNYLSHKTEA